MYLHLRNYEQATDYTCGPASLEIVLNFLGKHCSEARLAREAGTTPTTGTSHVHMLAAAHKEGFRCEEDHDASIQRVRAILKSGLPVIVNYIEPPEEIGHYAVVVGIEHDRVLVNDPANGRTVRFEEHEFLRRWHGTRSRKWMLVIHK